MVMVSTGRGWSGGWSPTAPSRYEERQGERHARVVDYLQERRELIRGDQPGTDGLGSPDWS
jgi:hypothetical protein